MSTRLKTFCLKSFLLIVLSNDSHYVSVLSLPLKNKAAPEGLMICLEFTRNLTRISIINCLVFGTYSKGLLEIHCRKNEAFH